MHYEEKWINDKLCYRCSPTGEWFEFKQEMYKQRIISLEKKVKNLNLHDVSKRSELLLDFVDYMRDHPDIKIPYKANVVVDCYIKSKQ